MVIARVLSGDNGLVRTDHNLATAGTDYFHLGTARYSLDKPSKRYFAFRFRRSLPAYMITIVSKKRPHLQNLCFETLQVEVPILFILNRLPIDMLPICRRSSTF
jgi:hypothetical protein